MADDEPTRVPLLAVVYKTQTQTLGAAYLEDGTTLRYCEVADTEFHMLRSLKFELNPDLIIAPANADAVWLAQLGSSSRGGADAETLLDDADPAVDEADPDGEAGTIPVQLGKSRDFSASSAAKRLVLLMHGRAQDDDQLQLTERESLIRLDHQLPREQEQAWRAVGGLLAHLQKEDAGQLSISTLAPHALDKVMRIAPEVLLSLNIFVDRHHPSVHGGKSRDAFSLWSLFNNTSSKPGEKLLRSWFARPSLDLEVLSQRQESIAFVISRQELLPQWKTFAKKIKDVRGLRASFDRGGLLLADYKAALSTAACAIHMRDMLLAAEASAERLHVMARLASVGSTELAELSNMIFGIVDFEASGRKDERAAKHICVKENVHPQLDDLRQSCAGMQNVLTSTAQEERARLERHSLMPQYALDDQLYVVFITQLGFMLKMPMPEVRPEEAEYVERDFEAAGLALQFHEEGEGFFKTAKCASLDDKYGDILSRMRDLESHLVRHLELQVLTSLSELLDAQSVLAELDCILALATAAIEHKLVRPRVVDGAQLDLKGAWHPLLHAAQQLVPNDCSLCAPGEPEGADRMLLLTGPNASGKTVYLRMVGITCFLAHIGSFVPAESATVGLTDAIFTRMVSRESTLANASAFMADLTQMSNMMRHSTRRSLCLVDEFGKGTNAQDGISFLYACLRHFLDRGRECPRLLACTHYTELLELPELVDRPGLSLWTMQVMLEKKTEADDTLDDVIFLYRAIPGRSEGSFAYHCAAAADVPRAVIDRAVQVSRLRDAGEPVHAMDRSEADAASERRRLAARDELLSGFLEFDFRTRRAGEFYVAHAACVDTLRQPATARAGGAFC